MKKNGDNKKNLFDYLNSLYNKRPIEYNGKIAPAYLLSLWLSHYRAFLPIVNRINPYHFLIEDALIYKYYWHKIPMGSVFIRWIKKDEKDIERDKKIEEFCIQHGISKREAMNYVELI
jgi:hypothetical protein